MISFNNRRLHRLELLISGICIAFILGGCSHKTSPAGPPSPDQSMTSGTSPRHVFLKWKEGLSLLIVDNIADGGPHSAGGAGTPSDPIISGYSKHHDGNGFQWEIKTPDGKAAKFKIDGKEYDLSKGKLFVVNVRPNGKGVEVNQIQRELSAVPFDSLNCTEYLKKDTEIMKLLNSPEQKK